MSPKEQLTWSVRLAPIASGALVLLLLLSPTACLQPHVVGGASPDSPLTLEQRVAALERGVESEGGGTATAQRANIMAEEIREYRKRTEDSIVLLQSDVQALNNRLDEMQRRLDDLKRGGVTGDPAAGGALSESQLRDITDRINDLTGKYNTIIHVMKEKDILTADPKKAIQPPSAPNPAPPTAAPSPTSPPADLPDEKSMYDRAYDLYKVGDFEKAREAFAAMLTAYPAGASSDNGRYWIGECYFSQKKFDRAIAEFSRLITDYPKSNKVCRSILKIGYSLAELGRKDEAVTALNKVIESCKNTEESQLAAKKKSSL